MACLCPAAYSCGMTGELNRRQILLLSGLALASFIPLGSAFAADSKAVDAGDLDKYPKDAIYPEFQPRGFFIIRRNGKLVAQSSICTHRGCKLSPAGDGFTCKCHGSVFDIDGKVQRPPARRDLSRFGIHLDAAGHVVVDLGKTYEPAQFGAAGASVEIKQTTAMTP